jgi:cardiolipin synthase
MIATAQHHVYRRNRRGRAGVSLSRRLSVRQAISIDSQICSIGSANIDIRSFSINYELNAVLYSDRLAQHLEADFFGATSVRCKPFDVAEYKQRNIAVRFRDSLTRLLSPLL